MADEDRPRSPLKAPLRLSQRPLLRLPPARPPIRSSTASTILPDNDGLPGPAELAVGESASYSGERETASLPVSETTRAGQLLPPGEWSRGVEVAGPGTVSDIDTRMRKVQRALHRFARGLPPDAGLNLDRAPTGLRRVQGPPSREAGQRAAARVGSRAAAVDRAARIAGLEARVVQSFDNQVRGSGQLQLGASASGRPNISGLLRSAIARRGAEPDRAPTLEEMPPELAAATRARDAALPRPDFLRHGADGALGRHAGAVGERDQHFNSSGELPSADGVFPSGEPATNRRSAGSRASSTTEFSDLSSNRPLSSLSDNRGVVDNPALGAARFSLSSRVTEFSETLNPVTEPSPVVQPPPSPWPTTPTSVENRLQGRSQDSGRDAERDRDQRGGR